MICPRTGDNVDAILNRGTGTQRTVFVTIGTRGGTDIPLRLWDDFCGWVDAWSTRSVLGLERGEMHGHLHIQGITAWGTVKAYSDEAKELFYSKVSFWL